MARSSSVNFESVEQICFQLLSQGENPSFNLVYAELGNKGSSEVVQRYIDQWRRETGAAFFRQRSIPGMPDELVSAADAFMANVWSLSLQQADRVLANVLRSFGLMAYYDGSVVHIYTPGETTKIGRAHV